jgi:hypothetical protein
MWTINTVYSIQALADAGWYEISANVTQDADDPQDISYGVTPGDDAPLNLAFIQWMTDHPDFPIEPYVPPTQDEIRANMSPLTRRQLWLGLIDSSLMPSAAQAVIDAMPPGVDKEKFNVNWNEKDRFGRLDPTVLAMLPILGVTPEEADLIWTSYLEA